MTTFRNGLAMASLMALAAFATPAQASESDLTICTGGPKGNYFYTGTLIEKQLNGVIDVDVVETRGSIDNLTKMAEGTCDAAIVQSDAYRVFRESNPNATLNFERVTSLYKEYAHMVCNKDLGVTTIKDLDPKSTKVMVGPMGGGSYVTWKSLGMQDKSYEKFPTSTETGPLAILKMKDGADAQCMFFVTGLKSGTMAEVNNASDGKLTLVEVDDWDFNDAKDEKGRPLYQFDTIPGGAYKSLTGNSWGKWDTITVDAVFVVKADWIQNNSDKFNSLGEALLAVTPTVRARVGQ